MAEMAASIAHELNQPLTALVADSHACRRWLNSEPVNIARAVATTERIVRECTRASAVVSRVRSLFTKSEYVREPTDINALIREMARLLRDDAIRRGVSIKLRLAEGIPLLNVDRVQIQQVLLNLAVNGMDAMTESEAARELEISSGMSGDDEVMVTVRDTGAGIAEETKARMFDAFFTTKPAGTGMGLSICRSIIEAHQGRIWAESLPGGAAFHFTLGSNA
jgi:signal transduction histidine kinase